ncbi:thiolase family protein [Rhodococcus sp. T2V]|uniref:thiolase family protein n=1 Tax=Rhodococcus sp. T2V TaxID=3034164 RepID=UPI0023E12172|nr:thiolase family protein [Rhodococcus sp. T2V]MDF3312237.1 thiolase family protein [Rhodococcus sp. T2V]
MVQTALGIKERRFTAHSGVWGAGIVGAAQMARLAIQSGQADVVLTYFGVDFGSSPGGPYALHAVDPLKASLEMPVGWYGQPLYFASIAQRYAYEYGLRPEQLGELAIAARKHAALTPGALRPQALDLEGYLASPMIAEPLRAADCCLVNDGAAAVVYTSLERARDLAKDPIVVAGVGTASAPISQSSYFTQHRNYLGTPATLSSQKAFGEAGLSIDEVDFAEIYDCFTITDIMQIEDLGFCGKGEGAAFVEGGRTGPGGAMPINTHGGSLAHSYLLGANHVVEAVRQLRHERGSGQVAKAEVGLVAGLGVPDHTTLLLTVDR